MENKEIQQEQDLDIENIINCIQKSLFKHIKLFNNSSKINIDIINRDESNLFFNIKYLKFDKEIYNKTYKKKHNSKRGLNSMANLWHNKNKIRPINDELKNNIVDKDVNINKKKVEEKKMGLENNSLNNNIFDENEINISMKNKNIDVFDFSDSLKKENIELNEIIDKYDISVEESNNNTDVFYNSDSLKNNEDKIFRIKKPNRGLTIVDGKLLKQKSNIDEKINILNNSLNHKINFDAKKENITEILNDVKIKINNENKNNICNMKECKLPSHNIEPIKNISKSDINNCESCKMLKHQFIDLCVNVHKDLQTYITCYNDVIIEKLDIKDIFKKIMGKSKIKNCDIILLEKKLNIFLNNLLYLGKVSSETLKRADITVSVKKQQLENGI